MVDLGVDPSVFERAAALLARPLSPTALEKEQLAKGGSQAPEAAPVSSRKPAAKAKGKAKAAAKPGAGNVDASPPSVTTEVSATTLAQEAEDCRGEEVEVADAPQSILAAVAELSDLQKDWKGKMNSPSWRKPAVPRVNRKAEAKTLTDDERQEKLNEINELEQQLEEAKGKAASATAAAAAAAAWVSERAAESDAIGGGESDDEKENGLISQDFQSQTEERVKARRRQEAQARRERERRDAEARQAKQREGEAKAKELERITKERMQSRLREEREKQQQERQESERREKLRNQRAANSEEHRLQAARRVAEREHAERRKALEKSELEAEHQARNVELSEVKAQEGRERTRMRMQQHARDMQAQQLLEEEARQRQLEAEAAHAAEQRRQAEVSQQRARARAAEFRQRARSEQEERARIEAEQLAAEQERTEAALLERQRKRNWRAGDLPVSESPRCSSGQPSPVNSLGGFMEDELRGPSPSKLMSVQDGVPKQLAPSSEAMPVRAVASKAVPSRAPRAEVARAPPRPPSDRVPPHQNKSVAGAAPQVGAVQQARNKPAQRVSETRSKGNEPSVNHAPGREGRANAAQVVGGSGDEPVRVSVGFFGVNDVDFCGDEDEEMGGIAARSEPVSAPTVTKASVRQASRESSSSQPTQQARLAPQASEPSRGIARAYSQPPPSRPPPMPGSRAESPVGRDDVHSDGCMSPGEASNQSDPMAGGRSAPRAQPQPWKQRAINIQPADFYLNKLKAARGQTGKPTATQHGGSSPPESSAVHAWKDGPSGYADQMRERARVVEDAQRQQEGARYERGYAVLQRVQQRAAQIPSRSASTESAF